MNAFMYANEELITATDLDRPFGGPKHNGFVVPPKKDTCKEAHFFQSRKYILINFTKKKTRTLYITI